MNLAIVAGRRWHSLHLLEAAEALGHSCTLITAVPPRDHDHGQVRYLRRHLPVQYLTGRKRILTVQANRSFAKAALRSLPDRVDTVVAFSSYAQPFIDSGYPTILVRGSHHIRRQSEILALAGVKRYPREAQIRAEEAEYSGAATVTVPTDEIAQDSFWGRVRPHVSPYGFPAVPAGPFPQPAHRGSRVLFVGEFGLRKGADRILAAFERPWSPTSQLTMIGRVTYQPVKKSLPDWWDIRGPLPHEAVLRAMQEADVLILPSREEGMAISGLEALASGLPVVATHASGLGRWLESGAGILLADDDDPTELRAAVAACILHQDAYSTNALDVARSWTWTDHLASVLSAHRHNGEAT